MDEELFLRFIANALKVHTAFIRFNDKNNVLEKFEKDYCFHKTLQPMYTKASLEYLLANTKAETFYEITDHLNTSLIIFQFKETYYLIGPYVKSSFSDKEMQTLLAKHKLTNKILLPLKLYYNQFPHLSYSIAADIIIAAIRAFYPLTPDFTYRKLIGFHEKLKKEKLIARSLETYAQIIRRYETENSFLKKISDGDTEGMELSLENLVYNFYLNVEPVDQAIYSIDNTGFAIIRTLARKAAEQGGCPVVKIDEISQDSIQKASRARSTNELKEIIKDFLIQLTAAVADSKKIQTHSPIIRNIWSYITMNYTESISLQKLAADYHISAEYMSRTFKKETGQTITDYIAELRTKKAAELLKTSQLSIAEISAFVGYPDSNYFVKVFKKRYGITPSSYRKT